MKVRCRNSFSWPRGPCGVWPLTALSVLSHGTPPFPYPRNPPPPIHSTELSRRATVFLRIFAFPCPPSCISPFPSQAWILVIFYSCQEHPWFPTNIPSFPLPFSLGGFCCLVVCFPAHWHRGPQRILGSFPFCSTVLGTWEVLNPHLLNPWMELSADRLGGPWRKRKQNGFLDIRETTFGLSHFVS